LDVSGLLTGDGHEDITLRAGQGWPIAMMRGFVA
jgi:hypothetical protein